MAGPRFSRPTRIFLWSSAAALLAAAAFVSGKRVGAGAKPAGNWLIGDTAGIVRPSQILGWEFIPGAPGVNSFGMLGREISRVPPEGKTRVLVIGDSFTEGAPFPEALNDAASRLGRPGVEFIRGGMRGYAPDTYLIWYRTYGRYFSPKVVLAFFYTGNDLGDIVRSHAYQGYQKPYFTLEGGALRLHAFPLADPQKRSAEDRFTPTIQAELSGMLGAERARSDRQGKNAAAAPMVGRLLKMHYFLYAYFPPYRFMKDQLIGWRTKRYPEALQQQISFGDLWYLRNGAYSFLKEGRDLEAAWRLNWALLEELRREVERDGARFAVVLVPHLWQVVPEARDRFLKGTAEAGYAIDLEAPRRRLREWAKRTGIPALDPTEALRAANAEGNPYDQLASAAHWSALGMRTVGESVVGFLDGLRWIPRR